MPIRSVFFMLALGTALLNSNVSVGADSPDVHQDVLSPASHSGPLARPIRGDGGTSAFYAYDKSLPTKPGELLRQEPLDEHQSVPGAAQSHRLLYSSTDGIDGSSVIAVSGSIFLPGGAPPKGGWPLLLWSHGTVGIADVCAPT